MSPVIHPSLRLESIAQARRRFGVERLEIFGSALRDDFGPDSDVNFLVVFRDDENRGPLDFLDPRDELGRLVGRKADLLKTSAGLRKNFGF